MKAKELAHLLLQHPDLDVLVDGYEAGYEDLRTVAIGKVVENYYVEDYYGPHELLLEVQDAAQNQAATEALILKRVSGQEFVEKRFEKVLCKGQAN